MSQLIQSPTRTNGISSFIFFHRNVRLEKNPYLTHLADLYTSILLQDVPLPPHLFFTFITVSSFRFQLYPTLQSTISFDHFLSILDVNQCFNHGFLFQSLLGLLRPQTSPQNTAPPALPVLMEYTVTWLRVQMSYHRFNNLSELLNGDLTAKIGRGIFSKDLMDRECNCYLPSKVNRNVSTNHILNFPPWISHMKP